MGDIMVDSGAVVEVPVRLQVDPENLKTASSKVDFIVESLTNKDISLTQTGRFLGPTSR